MKKLAIVVLVVMAMSLLAGCASVAGGTSLFSGHLIMSQVNGESAKEGVAESRVWLGVFGDKNYPTVSEAAKAGGITKIATVEYYSKMGIFGLFNDYFTIVTGE